jgi:transcriptional regulator with XRE-family HTH domain
MSELLPPSLRWEYAMLLEPYVQWLEDAESLVEADHPDVDMLIETIHRAPVDALSYWSAQDGVEAMLNIGLSYEWGNPESLLGLDEPPDWLMLEHFHLRLRNAYSSLKDIAPDHNYERFSANLAIRNRQVVHWSGYVALSGALAGARSRAGLTQRQLAEQMGISQAKVALSERYDSKRKPKIDLVMEWMEACGVPTMLTFGLDLSRLGPDDTELVQAVVEALASSDDPSLRRALEAVAALSKSSD